MRAGSALLLAGVLLPAAVAAEEAAGEPQQRSELDYATWLMAQEDWYRAIGALKRHRFFHAGPEADRVDVLIGLGYLRGEQWFDAWKALSDVAGRASAPPDLRARAALLGLKAAHRGGASLLVVTHGPPALEAYGATAYGPQIGTLLAHDLLTFARWQDAAAAFDQVAALDAGPLGKDAARLALEVRKAPRLSPKSPWLAAFLALVPGLGHVYAERYKDAWNALFPNAVLIPATGLLARSAHREEISWAWPSLVGTVALAFYAANVYSAANVTRQGNQLILAHEVARYRKGSELARVVDLAGDTPESVPGSP